MFQVEIQTVARIRNPHLDAPETSILNIAGWRRIGGEFGLKIGWQDKSRDGWLAVEC
jgi:hypothetical protein